MPEFNLAGVLLFLVPGLATYGALYGLIGFRSPAISPAPPPANSVKAAIVVLLSSLGVHAGTVSLIPLCNFFGSYFGVDADIYHAVYRVAKDEKIELWDIFHLTGGVLVQGLASALVVRLWLKRRSRLNTLPEWLFGWTTDFANHADDDDKTLVALVLTNLDIDNKTLAYGGIVYDLGVGLKGEITRLILDDCERYFIPLDKPMAKAVIPPLSFFDHFYIDASHIRNVTFEIARKSLKPPPKP